MATSLASADAVVKVSSHWLTRIFQLDTAEHMCAFLFIQNPGGTKQVGLRGFVDGAHAVVFPDNATVSILGVSASTSLPATDTTYPEPLLFVDVHCWRTSGHLYVDTPGSDAPVATQTTDTFAIRTQVQFVPMQSPGALQLTISGTQQGIAYSPDPIVDAWLQVIGQLLHYTTTIALPAGLPPIEAAIPAVLPLGGLAVGMIFDRAAANATVASRRTVLELSSQLDLLTATWWPVTASAATASADAWDFYHHAGLTTSSIWRPMSTDDLVVALDRWALNYLLLGLLTDEKVIQLDARVPVNTPVADAIDNIQKATSAIAADESLEPGIRVEAASLEGLAAFWHEGIDVSQGRAVPLLARAISDVLSATKAVASLLAAALPSPIAGGSVLPAHIKLQALQSNMAYLASISQGQLHAARTRPPLLLQVDAIGPAGLRLAVTSAVERTVLPDQSLIALLQQVLGGQGLSDAFGVELALPCRPHFRARPHFPLFSKRQPTPAQIQ